MPEAFDKLCRALSKLPGMGRKSAHRIAVHLAFNPESAGELLCSLNEAGEHITHCPVCCGISEDSQVCAVCADASRHSGVICLVESVSDMDAIEKSGAWRGVYHVLGGKLSPIKNVGPEKLNFAKLESRIKESGAGEIILALSNDIEGEATCHYVSKIIAEPLGVKLTRIGFGLPSGSQLGFADTGTIKSAIDARRSF